MLFLLFTDTRTLEGFKMKWAGFGLGVDRIRTRKLELGQGGLADQKVVMSTGSLTPLETPYIYSDMLLDLR